MNKMKYKNLEKVLKCWFCLNKKKIPTLNVSSLFMERIQDKNFHTNDDIKIIKICLQDKHSFDYYKITENNVIRFSEATKFFNKVMELKEPCLLFYKDTINIEIVYAIPFYNDIKKPAEGLIYGKIKFLNNLPFFNSPVVVKRGHTILIDVLRVSLYDIEELDFIIFLGKFFYDPKPSESIYVIRKGKHGFLHKHEAFDIYFDYDRILELYNISDNKKIILNGAYKVRFCDIIYGDRCYIIAKIYYSDYDMYKDLNLSLAI